MVQFKKVNFTFQFKYLYVLNDLLKSEDCESSTMLVAFIEQSYLTMHPAL